MCGIAGGVQTTSQFPLTRLVEAVDDDQHARGPDITALENIQGTGLQGVFGHTRLSIIDLSPEANQPMWDQRRRICIVYNGEIYNYVELRAQLKGLGHEFRTSGDTEVIIEAYREWGTRALERFNGPFAFALFDRDADRLVLARDRFGVKPLYYYADGSKILFASTPRVIAERLTLSPDIDYIARGIRYGVYDDGDAAPFDGLSALEAGTFLSAEAAGDRRLKVSKERYYRLDERVEPMVDLLATERESQIVDRLLDLVNDAIKVRFRADVPVAVSLSGGVDSATVAALANAQMGQLVAFTYGDPSLVKSEGVVVREFATRTGLSVQYVSPDVSTIAASYLETLRAQGAPFNGGSVIAQYLLYKKVKETGVRVLLGGQGGDEAFMGYRKYHLFMVQDLLARRKLSQAAAFLPDLASMLVAEFRSAGTYWRARHRYEGKADGCAALRLPPAPEMSPLGLIRGEGLGARQARDLLSTSLPSLLRYEDRNSMANSVESRLPFLDYRLVEFALALRPALKLRRGYGKWILREAVQGTVPDNIRLTRSKRGFDVEEKDWIAGGLGMTIRDALRDRWNGLTEWTEGRAGIDEAFSDHALAYRPAAFAEATALLWIADNTPRYAAVS